MNNNQKNDQDEKSKHNINENESDEKNDLNDIFQSDQM